MNELEKIAIQKKKLQQKERKARAREFEKIGRLFYKNCHAKDFAEAKKLAEKLSIYVSIATIFIEKSGAKSMEETQKALDDYEKGRNGSSNLMANMTQKRQ